MNDAKKAYESVSHLEAKDQERLLLEQLPQVRYIARRIHDRLPAHIAFDDLVQAGTLGLIEALHKFDPGKNVELKTYAKHRIQGAILDSLRDLDWSPRPLRRKARQLEQAHQRLRAQFGRPATEPELAIELGMESESCSICWATCAGSIWGVCRMSIRSRARSGRVWLPRKGRARNPTNTACNGKCATS